MVELNRQARKQYYQMKFHELMARKHRRKARFHYMNLIKIFGNEKTTKRILKEIGEKNELFNKGELKWEN